MAEHIRKQTTAREQYEDPLDAIEHYTVRWEIDAEVAASQGPRAAALEAWTEYFGRSPQPGPDECCVFEVIDSRGHTHLIDLSVAAEDAP